MTRTTLERYQVWIYLGAILSGLGAGSVWQSSNSIVEWLLWPVLIFLLFSTFVQIPLLHLREAFLDRRFALAVLMGNFVLIPLLVAVLLLFIPDHTALRLGVLLVLLVPCTDWFITFTQLGGGDVRRAIVVTPINLLLQVLLLPFYLWLMFDSEQVADLSAADFWPALLVILIPMLAALVSEKWIEDKAARAVWRDGLAWCPVPLLALVIFLIAMAQAETVEQTLAFLPVVMPLFIAFVLLTALLAKAMAVGLDLPRDQGRTLVFCLGTRNSFVVLPVALSLPAGWEVAAIVIVLQSLVELFMMIFYLWWVPRCLFK